MRLIKKEVTIRKPARMHRDHKHSFGEKRVIADVVSKVCYRRDNHLGTFNQIVIRIEAFEREVPIFRKTVHKGILLPLALQDSHVELAVFDRFSQHEHCRPARISEPHHRDLAEPVFCKQANGMRCNCAGPHRRYPVCIHQGKRFSGQRVKKQKATIERRLPVRVTRNELYSTPHPSIVTGNNARHEIAEHAFGTRMQAHLWGQYRHAFTGDRIRNLLNAVSGVNVGVAYIRKRYQLHSIAPFPQRELPWFELVAQFWKPCTTFYPAFAR